MIPDAVLLPIGVISVARTEGVLDGTVVLAALIHIANEEPDGCPGGTAFEHAGQNFHRIRLLPLSHMAGCAWPPAIQFLLDILLG